MCFMKNRSRFVDLVHLLFGVDVHNLFLNTSHPLWLGATNLPIHVEVDVQGFLSNDFHRFVDLVHSFCGDDIYNVSFKYAGIIPTINKDTKFFFFLKNEMFLKIAIVNY